MDQTCKGCRHFIQHYIKCGKSYRDIMRGHCVYPRLKNKKTDDKACEHYKERVIQMT